MFFAYLSSKCVSMFSAFKVSHEFGFLRAHLAASHFNRKPTSAVFALPTCLDLKTKVSTVDTTLGCTLLKPYIPDVF